MKKINNLGAISKRMVAALAIFAVLLYNVLPMLNANADTVVSLTVTFKDGNEEHGHVEYSGDNGATWTSINSNSTVNATVGDTYRLQVRIVPNETYSVDFSGMSYKEDDGDLITFENGSNGSVAGGLQGSNGYYASNGVTSVRLEDVEFRGGETNPAFDGRAVLIWDCDGSICYHFFEGIEVMDEHGNPKTNYYELSGITDEEDPSVVFSFDSPVRDFATYRDFGEYAEAMEAAIANGDIDEEDITIDKVLYGMIDVQEKIQELENGICADAEDVRECVDGNITILDRGIGLNPLEAPNGNSSYSHFGDRNFKVTIYDENYVGVTLGDISDFTYFPNFWNKLQFPDAIDLSGTTKANPAQIESVLLEDTITISSKGINGVEFTNVEALDVPEGTVTVTKNGNKFSIHFTSNFYDRVIFKITASNNKTYYLRIARITAKVTDNFAPGVEDKKIMANVYYLAENSYDDYEVYMTFVGSDGTKKQVKATHTNIQQDSLGNPMDDPEASGSDDNSLKYALYSASLPEGMTAVGAYVNVVKSGSTNTNYAGTFNGSNKGSYYDLTTRRVDYSK